MRHQQAASAYPDDFAPHETCFKEYLYRMSAKSIGVKHILSMTFLLCRTAASSQTGVCWGKSDWAVRR